MDEGNEVITITVKISILAFLFLNLIYGMRCRKTTHTISARAVPISILSVSAPILRVLVLVDCNSFYDIELIKYYEKCKGVKNTSTQVAQKVEWHFKCVL